MSAGNLNNSIQYQQNNVIVIINIIYYNIFNYSYYAPQYYNTYTHTIGY